MTAGLRMDLIDRESTPEVKWVCAADAPPGRWERHWHNPKPVTPLYADFEFGSHLALSEIVAAQEFAAIAATGAPARPRRLYFVIDGFAYRGEPAPGAEWGWLDPATQLPASTADPRVDDYEWQVLRRWDEETHTALVAALRRFRAVQLAGLSDEELRAHIRALSWHLVENWALYFTVDAAASVIRRRCEAFFQEHLGTTEMEFVQLFAGSSPATSEPIQRMDELARTVVRTPTLAAELAESSEPWRRPGLSAALAVYLEAFGHRASEWEYFGATLAERPDRVVQLLCEAVARLAGEHPSAAEVARQRRDTTVAASRRKLPTAPLRASFDRLLKDAQATFSIHEDNITLYMTGCGYMRYALLEAGARLAQRGLLAAAERVFFLRRGELEAALQGNPAPDLEATSAARWSDYQRQLHNHPPQTLVIAGSSATSSSIGTSSPAGASPGSSATTSAVAAAVPQPESHGVDAVLLKGLGASPGTYTGLARVIIGEEQFEEVQAGEVLVCPQTSPSWTILFGRIGALVTDDGGILSHPAIAAREFGLPAVVSTSSGTRVLATGQLIEVDGGVGTVRIVDAHR